MTAPIALQLYSVRDVMAREGFEKVVRQVADMGYVGVEPAGFPGTTPQKAGQLFAQLGLEVPSAHVALPLGEDKQPVLDTMAAIGCKRIVSGKGPDDFKTMDLIAQTCDQFNQSAAVAAEHGMQFVIHNHWWEYEKLGQRYVYEIMLEQLDPSILFEIDTYWVQAAGRDPAQVVEQFGPRAPLLHLKDGSTVKSDPMTAIGDGVLDFPRIIEAAGDHVEWLIVELDRCATDMVEAVAQSYRYLVGEGLARGKK